MIQLAPRWLVVWLLLIAIGQSARAAEAAPAAANPVLEARMLAIAGELRCLVCQNQTIADSHAGLAEDLRNEIRTMVGAGRSDAEIITYMTDRYGDFVLYRPPLKPTTVLLWFGPALMVVAGATLLVLVLRHRSRLPDERFEPEEVQAEEHPA
jgi:cytochrome c-type biogenesis protein CcmH